MKIEILKEFRRITGLGILECNKILLKNNYILNKAVEDYKNSVKNIFISCINDQKNGVVIAKTFNNSSILIQVNCDSDFISKNKFFLSFVYNIIYYIYLSNKIDLDYIKKYFFKKKYFLEKKIKENIILKQLKVYQGLYNYGYSHNNKIGVIVKFQTKVKNCQIFKQLCMHIVSHPLDYISIYHIPYDIFNKILKNIIECKSMKFNINKYKNFYFLYLKNNFLLYLMKNILINQKFLFDSKLYIFDLLKNNNLSIENIYKLSLSLK